MNLILLFQSDFIEDGRVRLMDRRLAHVTNVHRAAVGDALTVGLCGGAIGTGVVTSLSPLELSVSFDREPPPALPLTLILALPRPKVLNRVIASATSLGVKEIHLINSWRVEKSYWKSPRLSSENLSEQSILGLEQARDTRLPTITLHRLFRPFIESFTPRGRALVAHPGAVAECPRSVSGEVTLAIGPEGGFIAEEIGSFERAGFVPVSLGPRILRVETAVAALVARLF
ncbi:MAG TPA: 16S rRNA (uracil(1498)-N(3))-methyltransferase [Thermoanaerobaculia bacterium]|nr:16S rRNA (uracil(1498)-N(3))-methyltransferase [Thermoanaerobaculia bacterium]